MDFSDDVKAGYNDIADAYLAQRGKGSADVKLLDRFSGQLAAGSTVLDAGCGAGVPVTRILAEVFRVVGVDFAEAQLARARHLVPKARFVCANLRTVEFKKASFEAICSYYAIIHIPREYHADLFARFARFLKPDGLALLCLGDGDLPYDATDDYLGVPMAWSHFDAVTNERLIEASGFEIEWKERVEDATSPGSYHLFVCARKLSVRTALR